MPFSDIVGLMQSNVTRKDGTRKVLARKVIARHTALVNRDEEPTDDPCKIALVFHGTEIVLFSADQTATITLNGWLTPTTKLRVNSLLPQRIGAKAGVWMVGGHYFQEGMVMNLETGEVTGHDDAKVKLQLAHNSVTKTLIGGYVRGLTDELIEDITSTWHHLSTGFPKSDCAFCRGIAEGMVDPARPMTRHVPGRPVMDNHLLEHVHQRAYMYSLLWNAVSAAGYQDIPRFLHANNFMATKKSVIRRCVGRYLEDSLRQGPITLKTYWFQSGAWRR